MKFDKFTQEWFETQMANNPDEVFKLFDKLFEPRFSVAQMGITRQELLYWKKMGILESDDKEEKRSWVRINFFEYCWVRFVVQLRKINVPLEPIFLLKEKLFTMDDDDVKKMILGSYIKLKDKIKIKKIYAEFDLEEFAKNVPPFVISQTKRYFPPFNLLVLSLMIQRRSFNLLVNYEGDWLPLEPDNLSNIILTEEISSFLNNPFVSLPVHRLLDEFYSNVNIKTMDQKEIFNLTTQETKVLELLRKEGIKEIRIRLTNKPKGEIIIDTIEQKSIVKLKKEVSGLLTKGKFQDIRIYAEDGHLLLYEETNKIKV